MSCRVFIWIPKFGVIGLRCLDARSAFVRAVSAGILSLLSFFGVDAVSFWGEDRSNIDQRPPTLLSPPLFSSLAGIGGLRNCQAFYKLTFLCRLISKK